MVNAGDRVIVDGRRVGQARRTGVVTAVSGTLVTVRWDDGHVTTFAPSAGTMTVTPPGGGAAGR
jgi:Domain of unknown function (DUF1918)